MYDSHWRHWDELVVKDDEEEPPQIQRPRPADMIPGPDEVLRTDSLTV